jgi:hypothetical protein
MKQQNKEQRDQEPQHKVAGAEWFAERLEKKTGEYGKNEACKPRAAYQQDVVVCGPMMAGVENT